VLLFSLSLELKHDKLIWHQVRKQTDWLNRPPAKAMLGTFEIKRLKELLLKPDSIWFDIPKSIFKIGIVLLNRGVLRSITSLVFGIKYLPNCKKFCVYCSYF